MQICFRFPIAVAQKRLCCHVTSYFLTSISPLAHACICLRSPHRFPSGYLRGSDSPSKTSPASRIPRKISTLHPALCCSSCVPFSTPRNSTLFWAPFRGGGRAHAQVKGKVEGVQAREGTRSRTPWSPGWTAWRAPGAPPACRSTAHPDRLQGTRPESPFPGAGDTIGGGQTHTHSFSSARVGTP